MDVDAGVHLGRPFALSELVAAYGGHAPECLRERRVDRVVSPEHASRVEDLVIVVSARLAERAGASPAVLLVDQTIAGRVPPEQSWLHPHAWWVLAGILDAAVPCPTPQGWRAPSAVVDEGAIVSPTASIHAGAVVRRGARIGERSIIGENTVVHGRVDIGSDVTIGPCCVIGHPGFGFAEGPAGAARRIPQLGGVLIEEGVEIGALCTVDAGTLSPTLLGRGSKLDAHVHVGHNVRIGPGALVAAQVGFAGSVVLGRNVRVGGQAGFADHVEVGDAARVAAKSGVIGHLPAGAVVAGFPAVPRVRWLRAMAALLRLGERR